MDSERTSLAYTRDQTGLTSDERIGSLFQPDSLLPSQYFEPLHRKTLWEPEKRLMLAILEDAINCFRHNLSAQNGKRRLCQEAAEWVVETGSDWVFSFENICEALGFNPAHVRQCLLRWSIPCLAMERRSLGKAPDTEKKQIEV